MDALVLPEEVTPLEVLGTVRALERTLPGVNAAGVELELWKGEIKGDSKGNFVSLFSDTPYLIF